MLTFGNMLEEAVEGFVAKRGIETTVVFRPVRQGKDAEKKGRPTFEEVLKKIKEGQLEVDPSRMPLQRAEHRAEKMYSGGCSSQEMQQVVGVMKLMSAFALHLASHFTSELRAAQRDHPGRKQNGKMIKTLQTRQ